MENNSKKILIVEDDQFLREFYQELLASEGYIIDVASDGETGAQKVLAGGYDLVLLDIMLPKKDGIQILKELKTQSSGLRSGVVVVLTNLGQDSVIEECFKLGAVGYLIKSALSPDQVLAEIKNFLGKATDKSICMDSGSSPE